MRIFLTGGTRLHRLGGARRVRSRGAQVDALVRNSEKAAQVRRVGPAGRRRSRRAGVVRGRGSCGGRLVHTASRAVAAWRRWIDAASSTRCSRRRRASRACRASTPRRLGPRPLPRRRPMKRAAPSDRAGRLAARARAAGARCRECRHSDGRHPPGIVYGGSRGIVGDLLKDAANSLVRVDRQRPEPLAVVYDRDLGRPLRAGRRPPRRLRDFPRQRRGGRAGERHRRRDREPCARRARASGTCRSRKRGRRWVRTRMRSRSIRSSAARVRARSAGSRHCTRSRATPRGSSRNGGAARKRMTSDVSLLDRCRAPTLNTSSVMRETAGLRWSGCCALIA